MLIAGERTDFKAFVTDRPETAVFQVTDDNGNAVMPILTVANGGLVLRRKGRAHPSFFAPSQPGRYRWKFEDGAQVFAGAFRVQSATQPQQETPEPLTLGYRGPGARRVRGR